MEPEQTAPVLESEEEKHELRREVLDFLKLVAWFLIIFILLRSQVIEGYEVQGPSMEPNLHTNERILVLKLPHKLSQWSLFSGIQAVEQGDIVVFQSPDSPGKRYVKRVIAVGPHGKSYTVNAEPAEGGVPRDGVKVQFDRGEVFVNNQKVDEPYLAPQALEVSDRQELVLGVDELYVLGDNRPVSKDSRSFDAIHDQAVIGKAVLRFWPPSKISILE